MMRGIEAIFKRELRVHFFCFSNFLLAGIFTAVAGLFLFANISDWSVVNDGAVTGPFFMNLCLVTLVIAPLLSVRAFSEEKRLGTFELYFTYPLRDIEIVAGKWLAILFQMTFFLLPIFLFFHVLRVFGIQLQPEMIWTGFCGVWLIAVFAVSIGIFFSAICQSQALAITFNFVTLLFFWTNGWLGDLFFPKMTRWMSECWSAFHMKEFASGILDTNRILFYALGSTLMLVLSMLALELRTWKRS